MKTWKGVATFALVVLFLGLGVIGLDRALSITKILREQQENIPICVGQKKIEKEPPVYTNPNPPQLPVEFTGKYTDTDVDPTGDPWGPGNGIAPYPSPSVEIQTENLAFRVEELEQEQQRNQEIIQLLLDYYGVKIKYISEHMEIVPETGD